MRELGDKLVLGGDGMANSLGNSYALNDLRVKNNQNGEQHAKYMERGC